MYNISIILRNIKLYDFVLYFNILLLFAQLSVIKEALKLIQGPAIDV